MEKKYPKGDMNPPNNDTGDTNHRTANNTERGAEAIHLPNEAELLEVISQADSAPVVFDAAYHALDDTVGALLQSIFHKDDHSVQFVVNPLLTSDGPLGEIRVRTKLLLGLGVIDKQTFDDIDIFVTLKEWGEALDADKVHFADDDILFELKKVQAIQNIASIDLDTSMLAGLSESMLNMFLARHNQKVQSTIVLAITQIVSDLRSYKAPLSQ